ncbi:MAG: DUF711 family protein [Chloroflexota bacterium]|jgi:hypothetical protein|nr:DUF711 family protein [Chloroflexota bacterium]
MRIRSITTFVHPHWPISENVLQKAGIFARHAQSSFESAGYEVQTLRLATPPFSTYLSPEDAPQFITRMQMIAHSEGFEYVALGPAQTDKLESYAVIPDMLGESSILFFSGHLTTPDGKVSLPAARACAEIIHSTAPLEKNGFANLRFTALANVRPWSPFFPAAYHQGEGAAFALAIEGADLVVDAFSGADSLADARQRLIEVVETHAQKLEKVANQLAEIYPVSFKGIDFSPAPFPTPDISLGNALEKLGVPKLGLSGSLAAAAFLTDSLDRAKFKRTGFNGLMLPLLEDSTLSQRAAEGTLNVTDLLMFSSVCGTGLDTIPLPGDATVGQLQAVLLDLAALALRLDKPLTGRLMPVPGLKAGDETNFKFDYFANSKVLALPAEGLTRFFAGDESFEISPRDLLLKDKQ